MVCLFVSSLSKGKKRRSGRSGSRAEGYIYIPIDTTTVPWSVLLTADPICIPCPALLSAGLRQSLG